ncbi:alpha/beta hydrolase [Thiobacillus thioparus]|uniref:alpha/beta hydrolase n=1 Tax=Thiobacillus thioparus TaxID=931 RepID=UPI0004778A48|nr:alpha/beta fold hydrolase [Thiobacillus thioparus]
MRLYLLCLLMSVFPVAAHAAIVQQEMRPGIPANAEYLIGQRSKPAVLLLHGFLQTREFPTVATLARGLQDAGYTVLLPTLSLNIPNRMQSLACEAAHKHSMDDDVAEIGRWVDWLKSHGHHSIVLIGHSFGSLQLLAYLSTHPDPAIKAFIGASLVEAQIGTTSRQALIAQLEAHIQNKQRTLVTQSLSFCRKYTSTPEGLLSYVRWDQPRLLTTLKQMPTSVQLIMGDADGMLGQGWLKVLQHIQIPMVIVHGGSHFMDGEHEFDLLDHTLKFLEAHQQGSSR